MTRIASATAVLLFLTISAPSVAFAQARAIDVPAGSLAQALGHLGRQTGVTIASADTGVAGTRVRRIRGTMDVEKALRKLLKGSEFEALRVDAVTFVVRRTPQTIVTRPHPPSVAITPAAPATGPDIIITATKLPQRLEGFAGAAHVLLIDTPELSTAQGAGSRAIVEQLPVMASTGLGPGRDKLFLRGIADSSFAGPTQATVGQYLGELRLNYNAPDPSLPLYDLASIEVLEGPQATLYGAGSLGGVLRLVPRPPKTGVWEASLIANAQIAGNQQIGGDLAGIFNLPVTSDIAIRALAYSSSAAGLVDDVGRNLRSIGRIDTIGGRGAAVTALGDGWSLEFAGVYQRIKHRDARYAEGVRDPPSRNSTTYQPSAIGFALGSMVVRKGWANGVELVSASAVVRNDIETRYDLSRLAPRLANDTRNTAVVFSNETRLTRRLDDRTGWVVGAHGVISSERQTSAIYGGAPPPARTTVENNVVNIGLFGQATISLAPRWTATLGGRLTYAEAQSLVFNRLPQLLPSAALAWTLPDFMTAYLSYQHGFRVGGLTSTLFEGSDGIPTLRIEQFRPDSLDTAEIGVRFGNARTSPMSGSVAMTTTRWRNIQADLFSSSGPYTTNIGNGRILGLEGSALWRPSPSLTLSMAAFLADSRLERESGPLPSRRRERLPNVPSATARLTADWQTFLAAGTMLRAQAQTRFVGRSSLGVGEDRHVVHGNHVESDLAAEIERGRITYFARIDNILNERGNRFASGNPYLADRGDQRIPLEPRTLTLGIRTTF